MSHPSFEQASESLLKLAELQVPTKQVERRTQRIGQERCSEREQQVAAYQSLPLVQRKGVPTDVTAPAVAVVQVDGGRMQILERAQQTRPTEPEEEALDPETAWQQEGRRGKHWREDKIGLLLRMTSEKSEHDPCPEIPSHFIDPTRIAKLARELKKHPPIQDDGLQEASDPDEDRTLLADDRQQFQPPEVEQKKWVASRCCWPDFGPKLATAAWQEGFFGSPRKAFVADGSDNNWAIWRKHFSSFEPVLDFIHALSYVFAAAMAGRSFSQGWPCYVQWITWVWEGSVELVIADLQQRQAELGTPEKEEAETSPRKIIATALTYLQNQKERMRYDQYRREGLPMTSSYVESAVKQINQRVKGTEKFWTENGAEAILQLRADYLSEGAPLDAFWKRRQDNETGQRRYTVAA